MLYETVVKIYEEERSSDGMGGQFSELKDLKTVQVNLIDLPTSLLLEQSGEITSNQKRLITDWKLPSFNEQKTYIFKESGTNNEYRFVSANYSGKHTILLVEKVFK